MVSITFIKCRIEFSQFLIMYHKIYSSFIKIVKTRQVYTFTFRIASYTPPCCSFLFHKCQQTFGGKNVSGQYGYVLINTSTIDFIVTHRSISQKLLIIDNIEHFRAFSGIFGHLGDFHDTTSLTENNLKLRQEF